MANDTDGTIQTQLAERCSNFEVTEDGCLGDDEDEELGVDQTTGEELEGCGAVVVAPARHPAGPASPGRGRDLRWPRHCGWRASAGPAAPVVDDAARRSDTARRARGAWYRPARRRAAGRRTARGRPAGTAPAWHGASDRSRRG